MKEEMPKEVKNVLIFVIGISLVCLTILILIVFFSQLTNNLGFEQVTFSSSESILTDNGTTTTLSENPTSLTATTYNNSWLSFDGVNDYLNSPITPFYERNGTMSFWMNVSNKTGIIDVIFTTRCASSNDGDTLLQLNSSGNMNLYKGSATNFNSILGDKINHYEKGFENIIITRNNDNASIYVDSVLVASNSTFFDVYESLAGSPCFSKSPTSFGAKFYLDEVRFYNRSLTQLEISEIYNSGMVANNSLLTDDLESWLPLNEGSGTDVHSFSVTDFT